MSELHIEREIEQQHNDSDNDRVAHYVAVPGTALDPVRLTLCGITLTDGRHTKTKHGICVVCDDIRRSLMDRGLF